ncbi:hypothetical protein Tco_0273216 [Tanacetum coccineum]
MHVYWASCFILTARIILDIEQHMRGFLWCQGEMRKGKAKVAWALACLPKSEGGLGICSLDSFNISLVNMYIWSLLTLNESLWVKWIHAYKLMGHNFWDFLAHGNMSWGWRKLHQVRLIIRQFFCLVPSTMDLLVWKDRNGLLHLFSAGMVWNSIRTIEVEVEWAKVVWFTHCIPWHAAKSRSVKGVLPKLVFAALVYFIRQEWNYRLFQKKKRSKEQLIEEDEVSLVDGVFKGCILGALGVILKLGDGGYSVSFVQVNEELFFGGYDVDMNFWDFFDYFGRDNQDVNA